MYENEDERLDWAEDQLKKAEVPEQYQALISRLLEHYWAHPAVPSLNVADAEKTLGTFAQLAQGHVLVPEEPEAVWVQAKPGSLVIRDTIRVKADAYSGDAGLAHNGRVGVVTAIRYGDIHIRYTDDKEPSFKDVPSVRHSPYALEKRVR
jgi:hypothetical protein